MYLPPVSRASAPGANPVAIGQLPEWLPQPLKDLGPTNLFIYGGVAIVLLAIVMGGGITTGRGR